MNTFSAIDEEELTMMYGPVGTTSTYQSSGTFQTLDATHFQQSMANQNGAPISYYQWEQPFENHTAPMQFVNHTNEYMDFMMMQKQTSWNNDVSNQLVPVSHEANNNAKQGTKRKLESSEYTDHAPVKKWNFN